MTIWSVHNLMIGIEKDVTIALQARPGFEKASKDKQSECTTWLLDYIKVYIQDARKSFIDLGIFWER